MRFVPGSDRPTLPAPSPTQSGKSSTATSRSPWKQLTWASRRTRTSNTAKARTPRHSAPGSKTRGLLKFYWGSRFDEIGPDSGREGRVDMGYLNRPSQRRRWANLVKTLRGVAGFRGSACALPRRINRQPCGLPWAWQAVCCFGCQTRLLVKGRPFTSSRALQPIPPSQRATPREVQQAPRKGRFTALT